jgi:hypothetical protein
LESINQQYEGKREVEARSVSGDPKNTVGPKGGDDGPEAPYPIRFSGKAAGTSLKERNGETTVPTAKLVDVPQDTLMRLSGVYFGWASIARAKTTPEPSVRDENFEKWLPAVVIVTPERSQTATVVERKAVHVHIVHDRGKVVFTNAKVNLMIMGFIRPISVSLKSEPDLGNQEERSQEDIALTNRVLREAAWQPETVLERIKSASSGRSFTERVADARQSGQRQLDKVPVHRLGVRTDSMGLKDQLIGNGGICIKR